MQDKKYEIKKFQRCKVMRITGDLRDAYTKKQVNGVHCAAHITECISGKYVYLNPSSTYIIENDFISTKLRRDIETNIATNPAACFLVNLNLSTVRLLLKNVGSLAHHSTDMQAQCEELAAIYPTSLECSIDMTGMGFSINTEEFLFKNHILLKNNGKTTEKNIRETYAVFPIILSYIANTRPANKKYMADEHGPCLLDDWSACRLIY
jgi:hypothetical protein